MTVLANAPSSERRHGGPRVTQGRPTSLCEAVS